MKIKTLHKAILIVISLTVLALSANAANHCVIIQYHHISEDTPAVTSVTPTQFDAHLKYLSENKFNVLPLQDVVTQLNNHIELPEKCISLSVDDAYNSVYSTAYPKLKNYGWHLTTFVNTEAVDEQRQPYMTWAQMREMAKDGFSFENHSHSHSHLIRRDKFETHDDWQQRVSAEILTAQNRITAELGIAPTLFAHPYGEFNPEIAGIIEQFGLTGFGQQSGPVWPDANKSALPRFPMAANYADLPGFITKVNSLAMPVSQALPEDPLLDIDNHQPELLLQFVPGSYRKDNIQCFVNGSKNVSMSWLDTHTLSVKPNFDLPVGRSRTNCTMPSNQKGRFHWYSHNWIKRHSDGSWYQEY